MPRSSKGKEVVHRDEDEDEDWSGEDYDNEDDWTNVKDPNERRKIQNRIAQRKFRKYISPPRGLSCAYGDH